MTELVLAEARNGIAILTLNRPEKLNALNYALIDRLLAVLDAAETDDDIRAIILTGAGSAPSPPAATSMNSQAAWPTAPTTRCAISSCAASV